MLSEMHAARERRCSLGLRCCREDDFISLNLIQSWHYYFLQEVSLVPHLTR